MYADIIIDISHEQLDKAFDFYKNEITLPLYSKLTDEQVDYIISRQLNAISIEQFEKYQCADSSWRDDLCDGSVRFRQKFSCQRDFV